MMRFLAAKLTLLLLFGLASCVKPAAHGVSADFVTTDLASPAPVVSGRIYLDDAGMRVESEQEDYTSIIISDFSRNVGILLQPDDRSYSEFSWPEDGLGFGDWRTPSDGDPCGAGTDEHITAKNLGFETLRRRRVEKWHCAAVGDEEGNRTFTLWRDPSLPLSFVRLEAGDGLITNLYNIRVGPQPADLFQVPPGYTKWEPPEGTVLQAQPDHGEGEPPEGLVIQVLPD